jgi:hypothetical protein
MYLVGESTLYILALSSFEELFRIVDNAPGIPKPDGGCLSIKSRRGSMAERPKPAALI